MAVVVSPANEPPAPTHRNSFTLLTSSRLSIPNSSATPSPVSAAGDLDDGGDHTVTGKRIMSLSTLPSQPEDGDLRLLAVSSQITEVAYSISDIQTRIFEIQELRHKAQAEPQSSTGSSTSSAEIDQALINLDERLEAVSQSITAIGESLAPLRAKTPTQGDEVSEESLILRKHQDLLSEWDSVQNDAETLRSELHEDKWLAVFRTVSEQADGMMSSLEKAVQQCQEFIWQVQRHDGHATSSSGKSLQVDKLPNFEVFSSLLQSYEAKKKHYEPSITKVLSVLDKGVRDRVTKNGECLRRHGDSRARWRNLRERITRTDTEMENVRRILVNRDKEPESSEAGSSVSRFTAKSKSTQHLSVSTPARSRYASSSAGSTSVSTLSRSMSPIKKFAAKVTAGIMTPGRMTPTSPRPSGSSSTTTEQPSKRSSFFSFRKPQPQTPERPRPSLSHPYPLGNAPAASTNQLQRKASQPQLQRKVSQQQLGVDNTTIKGKQRWNSSTKLDPGETGTGKYPPVTRWRTPSAMGNYGPSTPGRSNSPTSQASSRPWSPVNSQSTTASQISPPNTARPSSRANSRMGAATPYGTINPRARPQTPSQIPAPIYFGSHGSQSSSEDLNDPPTTLMQRMSPSLSSAPSAPSPSTTPQHAHTRSVSRSMIPVPKLNFNGPSRPGSAMSQYRSTSPSLSATSSSPQRSHTPEAVVKARAQQMPFYSTSVVRPSPRSTKNGAPPTSFRDGATPTPNRTVSRPGSRAAGTYDRSNVFTPSLEQNPVPLYGPANSKDPLDVEVAKIVNGFPHGFLIERVDPPLRTTPKSGEEIKAQYSVSNALSKKVITCRLVILNRSNPKTPEETQTKKVMCRVGGGWLDLQMYLLNRQAGLS